MGHHKEDKKKFMETGYKTSGTSKCCKCFLAILMCLCFGVLCACVGYYFGHRNVDVENDSDYCESPKVMSECAQPCKLTCDNLLDPPICTDICQLAKTCICPPGYVERSSTDDTCVLMETCSDSIVGENSPLPEPQPGDYYVGMGRYDVTGPVAQVNMMGYAVPSQIAHGLHMRLYARAFIFADLEKKNRVAFVSVDSGMGSQIIKLEVIKRLKAKYGDMYNEKNVVLSGTHSHSGPAGFFQFLLFEVTSLGYIKQSTESFVDGVVKSIDMAHNDMKQARISMTSGDVDDANINRSPSAYTHNPDAERAKYEHNTEHEMTLLKIESTTGEEIGLVNWYPVHGTSMNNTNELISSDNKGRASTLYEAMMRKEGKADFVAAFAQANLGDVSPNTKGPICIDSGKACDYEQSTCGFPPRVTNCIAFGPGDNMFESTDIIGTRQFDAAKRILSETGSERLQGPVSFAHQYVDMTKEQVPLGDGTTATTCKPAMGYSFAAGTTDGPGALNFKQSMTHGTPLWTLATKLIGKIVCKTEPDQAYYDCHKPKPVLLPTGYMDIPYSWHPSVVDVQLLRVGQLVIAAVPGEFTTMAGRRLKDSVKAKAIEMGMPADTKVVIAGLSNVYTHYITTVEEFGAQRYEGGSTIFGPHTHAAYVNRFTNLAENLVKGTAADPGPPPENIIAQQIELLPPPRPDRLPAGKNYGDVMIDVKESYRTGSNVMVKFYGANPRHDMRLGMTYLEVQRLDTTAGDWVIAYTDADWETKFHWQKLDNANVTREKLTVIDGIVNLIAAVTGYHINIDRMEALFNAGQFTEADLEVERKENEEFEVTRTNLINKLVSKGILSPVQKPVREYPTTDESHITIEWNIPTDQTAGTYRIVYYGNHLAETGEVTAFQGMTGEFQVRQ